MSVCTHTSLRELRNVGRSGPVAGVIGGAAGAFYVALLIVFVQMLWQVTSLDINDADNCLSRFRSNREFGLIVFAAIVIDMALAAIF